MVNRNKLRLKTDHTSLKNQGQMKIMIATILSCYFLLFTSSCAPTQDFEKDPSSINDIELSTHQLNVLNGFNLFEDFRWHEDVSRLRYRLPLLENGKITIYDESPERKDQLLETLIFQNGLIFGQGKEGRIGAQYDENGNLLSFMALSFEYEDGVLVSGNNGSSKWTYEYSDDCISKTTSSNSSDFIEQKRFCWDEDEHLISLATTRNQDFSNEFHYYTYSGDQLVKKSYVETKEEDTLSYSNFKVQDLQNGLILEYTDESMVMSGALNVNTRFTNSFEVLSESPLRLKKSTFKDGEPYKIILIEFNEDGLLSGYMEEGKYGEKYRVEYQNDAKPD